LCVKLTLTRHLILSQIKKQIYVFPTFLNLNLATQSQTRVSRVYSG